jgi:hypothetical protein
MIRPVTLVCFLLACGAGLYLYSAKHRVQLVDHEIEKTVRATDELREQIRVLHAEWTLQNDPQRLQALADQFLTLKTLTPGQFTSLADLDKRLPAVPAPEPTAPEATEPEPVPVAQAPQPEELPPAPAAPRPAVQSPPPARPAAAVAVAAPPVSPPAEHKPPPPPRPVLAEAPREHPVIAEVQQVRPSPAVARRVIVAEQPRPAQPPARLPITGSALGMARSATAPPPPRPMPVSASQWVSNGGGG